MIGILIGIQSIFLIVLVVICRLKSTRLPKKALLLLNGIPTIEKCLLNCLTVSQVKEVVLTTSDLPQIVHIIISYYFISPTQ
ncbi:cytidylyltransferase domain-containing protein [Priestia aryabhattai]|uniref:cytidylyltransferase domain-containing protein n=1 Tax=Priestia megaterium TaxID=1404 RepID=UPI0039B8F66C